MYGSLRIRNDFTRAQSLPAVECTDCCNVAVRGAGSFQVTTQGQAAYLVRSPFLYTPSKKMFFFFPWGEINPGYKGNGESAPCVLSVSEIARN